ncbi:TonB-dependent receptor [Zeaxanthinibacter sp. PT1]|uniref:TonB-dependent receptor n=1 Tax=Zeaxanthinibacter TaxID=561554 RepID=UPI002349D6A2|nr:TonB-dependent receptor [Zeaxanthinibacter sp. PT1]MDC6351619.1 TonB-dependent receptor [Zeaxanthinibacter sp. PT1]
MKFYICIAFLLWGSITVAQYQITGKVTAKNDGTTLEQVSVYFPQLEKGTVTNENGEFTIENLPAGSYKLIASYIGFKTYSATVDIPGRQEALEIALLPSAIEMEEVIVSTPFHKLQRENVMKVEQAGLAELRTKGSMNLSDGITNIPGVESVSTGIGIGKPVIRGLSANRVLVYTQGIRLENQQFGDEHGLGVDDAGIESVEVIKGPASLLYGSDALGGVLYLNPEKFADSGNMETDASSTYFGNTAGYSANIGTKISGEAWKYLLRASLNNHKDYETGEGLYVTNSRYRTYDLKTGVGFQQKGFISSLRYNYNLAELGIPSDISSTRGNRDPLLPNQEIGQHIISSVSEAFFKNSSLKMTLGYIFNDRKEFEDHEHEEEEIPGMEEEEGAALHMKLSTFNYNLQYQLPRTSSLETIIGVQGMSQTNRNFGEEILIPDATTNDVGILATSHWHLKNNDLQFGLRYDHRSLKSDRSGEPGQEEFIEAVNRQFNSFNAALGWRTDISESMIGRINLASGFRAPNLAELTSNGTHEGTNRFEIGNANLANEKNIQADLALEYKNEHFEWYANGFYNQVSDYIFLRPTGELREGDAVFNYEQEDASLYGGEIGLHIHPHPLDWLHLESSFESVIGELDNGSPLPLIPANSFTNTLRVEFENGIFQSQDNYAFVTLNSVLRQDRVSSFETETPAYSLLSLGAGSTFSLGKELLQVRISANNLLNENYIAHLSRLKPDGWANMGRNISLGATLTL